MTQHFSSVPAQPNLESSAFCADGLCLRGRCPLHWWPAHQMSKFKAPIDRCLASARNLRLRINTVA